MAALPKRGAASLIALERNGTHERRKSLQQQNPTNLLMPLRRVGEEHCNAREVHLITGSKSQINLCKRFYNQLQEHV
jgi:hypothetical protein